ncbi:hypothetical protein BC938DRAFT_478108 [Jimgerdemannia flammicorona]|uniref:Uncharacterized protein n=1 Tax=Jimgerdemannia flammicorona TaxID=994334 RepID=A0A433QNF7_9FUNG|nr:hypothetical protein BC938DRAFT_478108 [Jimgerdemannia flammicorona]
MEFSVIQFHTTPFRKPDVTIGAFSELPARTTLPSSSTLTWDTGLVAEPGAVAHGDTRQPHDPKDFRRGGRIRPRRT